MSVRDFGSQALIQAANLFRAAGGNERRDGYDNTTSSNPPSPFTHKTNETRNQASFRLRIQISTRGARKKI